MTERDFFTLQSRRDFLDRPLCGLVVGVMAQLLAVPTFWRPASRTLRPGRRT